MNLKELLARRLIFLTGKGGVGKTTVAILLALVASQMKKRTLLAEMYSTERVAPYFGLNEIGHQEIPLAPYLTGINLDPQKCFEEYILMQIHFRKIFDVFINNRFVTSFLNAVPGFNELLMVGKVFDLERTRKGKLSREPLYDIIIVDGLATGHGLSSFEIPYVVNRMVRVGPLHRRSQQMIDLLSDRDRTAFSVTTIPEEMPVSEAIELVRKVQAKLGRPMGPLFLNRMRDMVLTDGELSRLQKLHPNSPATLNPYFTAVESEANRSRMAATHSYRIKQEIPDVCQILIPEQVQALTSKKHFKPLVDELLRQVA